MLALSAEQVMEVHPAHPPSFQGMILQVKNRGR